MNTYYEHIQDNKSGLQLSDHGNFVYPSHFHHKIELFILKSGEMTVSCNGSVYNLTGNSVAFFNSYDVHEYLSQSENLVGFCVIIPPAYAMRFAERNKNKKVKKPNVYKP